MEHFPTDLQQTLRLHHQEHVLDWWETLSALGRSRLVEQLRQVDFPLLLSVLNADRSGGRDSGPSRAEQAMVPRNVIRLPATDDDRRERERAAAAGEGLLRGGRVAVVTVAGGQGTRLGFDDPKGVFPIGPVSERSLFQVFAEQILARSRRHGVRMPWLIMTSTATHEPTVQFFQQRDFFGLPEDDVRFFCQGSLPAVDAVSGRLLRDRPDSLCLSPDGHGGLVTALKNSGLLDALLQQGVEHLFYHQVDNPTVIMLDPVLIGLHSRQRAEVSTVVVRKVRPEERMGALVDIGGRTEIIEYSELSPEQVTRTDETGEHVFWAGNTAIHVFDTAFLDRLSTGSGQLPLHLARKAVPHLSESGERIEPESPNAFKLERFIFDALPMAERTLIVEGDRDREFNPVKNAEGADSPETARTALSRIARDWLRQAGVAVPEFGPVEISPLTALDPEELRQKALAGEINADMFR
ncbi:MAG: UDPGP type 1 family protein [Planctomycetaceae bacterium]|nr:UDPGP type 1 family protein [Planctomycetaceae bacterium]